MNRVEYLLAVDGFQRKSRSLPTVPPSSSGARAVHIVPPEHNRRPDWFDELVEITERPEASAVLSTIVHGSFGDGTAIAYSDLDLTLLVDEHQLAEPAAVRRTNTWINRALFPFLVRVDPLQHHGPFLLWHSFTQNYSEKVLPMSAYAPERAWSTRPTELSFRACDNEIATSLSIDCARRLGNAQNTFFRRGFDRYSAKRFVSNATLLPAYFLTDIEHPTHKAGSFEIFYNRIGYRPELLRLAEELRVNWVRSSSMARRAARLASRSKVSYRAVHLADRARDLRDDIEIMSRRASELLPDLERALQAAR